MVSAPVCGEALGEGAAGGGDFTPAQPAVRSTKSSPTMSAARINGSSARISFIGFSRVTFYDTPHCLNTVTSSALLNAVLWRTSLIVLGPAFLVPSTLYEVRRTPIRRVHAVSQSASARQLVSPYLGLLSMCRRCSHLDTAIRCCRCQISRSKKQSARHAERALC